MHLQAVIADSDGTQRQQCTGLPVINDQAHLL
jgi:hypothetical protein